MSLEYAVPLPWPFRTLGPAPWSETGRILDGRKGSWSPWGWCRRWVCSRSTWKESQNGWWSRGSWSEAAAAAAAVALVDAALWAAAAAGSALRYCLRLVLGLQMRVIVFNYLFTIKMRQEFLTIIDSWVIQRAHPAAGLLLLIQRLDLLNDHGDALLEGVQDMLVRVRIAERGQCTLKKASRSCLIFPSDFEKYVNMKKQPSIPIKYICKPQFIAFL